MKSITMLPDEQKTAQALSETKFRKKDFYFNCVREAAIALTEAGKGELIYKSQTETGTTLWGKEDQSIVYDWPKAVIES